MPQHDKHDPFDPCTMFPVDLGRFNCAGRYVMPSGSIRHQERQAALWRIGLGGQKRKATPERGE